MTAMPQKLKARADRKSAKRDAKKRLLAASAVRALTELGYANTSLRDIAEKSDLSLGMLHYYFEDRSDLIIYCVSVYKEDFVHSMIDAIEASGDRESVVGNMSYALAQSIVEDSQTHRLWYDIRTQSMFDETFRPVVQDIESKLVDVVTNAFVKAGQNIPDDVELQYALLDGLFQYLMHNQQEENSKSPQDLTLAFKSLLDQLL